MPESHRMMYAVQVSILSIYVDENGDWIDHYTHESKVILFTDDEDEADVIFGLINNQRAVLTTIPPV